MSPEFDRKAAMRAYKERKVRPGIYAVRELGTGTCWAGSALDLDCTKNGLWHSLNAGRHLDKGLQERWNLLSEDHFEYVVLEVIKDAMTPMVLKETLKEKKAEWTQLLATAALR